MAARRASPMGNSRGSTSPTSGHKGQYISIKEKQRSRGERPALLLQRGWLTSLVVSSSGGQLGLRSPMGPRGQLGLRSPMGLTSAAMFPLSVGRELASPLICLFSWNCSFHGSGCPQEHGVFEMDWPQGPTPTRYCTFVPQKTYLWQGGLRLPCARGNGFVWHGRGVHKGSRWSAKGQIKGGMWPEGCGQERHDRKHGLVVKYCNASGNSTPRIDPTLERASQAI